jgi:outer membrane protein assembly factor BamB
MTRILTLVFALVLTLPALAGDWAQWLGPRRDGSSDEKVAPWKGELKPIWRIPVGEGHSSPIVAGGRVYLHTRVPGKEVEALQCFNAGKGEQIWRQEYPRPPFKGLYGDGPRATPCIAGAPGQEKLFAFGATGIVSCFSAKTGDPIWRIDTAKEYAAPALKFGFSSSPLVVDDKLLIMVGAKDASVVAFNADNGKVIWKSGSSKATYAAPIVIGESKDKTAVFLNYEGLAGFRLEDGAPLWQYPFVDKLAESSTTPVLVGKDSILISSITRGTALVGLEAADGKRSAKQQWFEKDLTCYFSTPVVDGKEIYLVTGSFFKGIASLHCLDAVSGKELWKRDNVGKYHASLMRTGDGKLLMLEEKGDLVLIAPNPKAYREVCRAKLCGETWAHPALANGRLFIRDGKDLLCVDLSSESP